MDDAEFPVSGSGLMPVPYGSLRTTAPDSTPQEDPVFLASASAPRSLCHGCSISHRSMDAARLLSWGWLRIEPVSSLLPVKSPDASSASGLLRRRVGHYLLTCRLPAHHPSTSLLKSPLDPGANYVPGRETYILRPCDHFGPGDFSSVVFGIGNVVALIRSVTVLHQTTNACGGRS